MSLAFAIALLVSMVPASLAADVDDTITLNGKVDAGISLAIGSNLITVTTRDMTGNTASDTITVSYDATAPNCTISLPTPNAVFMTNVGTVDISGIASDNVAVTYVNWSNAATGATGTANGTDVWSIAGIALSYGDNLFTVTAMDASGNSGSDNITVVYDASAPTCRITSPTIDPTFMTNLSRITLAGEAWDNIGVVTVTWSNSATGDSGSAVGTTSWSITGIDLVVGNNTITVTVTDAAGNSVTDTITVRYGSAIIPEFSDLTVVVLGAIVVFFLFRTKRRREETQ